MSPIRPPRPAPRTLGALLVGAMALFLSACGLAESIAEGFVDDEIVVLVHRLDRSGTLVRMADGTEIEAFPATLSAGDEIVDAHRLCVFGFAIDSSLQPGNTEIDRATLRIWVEPGSGVPEDLGPLVVSHLPTHPDQLLALGQVPHPPGNDLGSLPGPYLAGWRDIDVTAAFLQDWSAARSISAFAVRFTSATNGDGQSDGVTFDGTDGEGQDVKTHLVLRFSLSL